MSQVFGMPMSLSRRLVLKSLAQGAAGLSFAAPALARTPICEDALDPARIQAAISAAHTKFRDLAEGANADYIPVLKAVPSTLFGIVLVTVDGKVYSAGDSQSPFSIQSISKVFTLAEVLDTSGEKDVEDSVGVDATGQVFNSITAVESHKGKAMTPFVNPGAIATTGRVKGATADEVWARIVSRHAACAGRDLTVDQEVYRSESATNERNRAIGMLMSAYGRFSGDPAQAVDLYTRQCSISVTARDLGVMAATLAAGGHNPVTGKQAITGKHVPGILAVMATAGLYDTSGEWLFHTGLPAKSGVGGGMIAVAPGKFGIGTFSPPLDAAGNSVRGQRAITDISAALASNPYDRG